MKGFMGVKVYIGLKGGFKGLYGFRAEKGFEGRAEEC